MAGDSASKTTRFVQVIDDVEDYRAWFVAEDGTCPAHASGPPSYANMACLVGSPVRVISQIYGAVQRISLALSGYPPLDCELYNGKGPMVEGRLTAVIHDQWWHNQTGTLRFVFSRPDNTGHMPLCVHMKGQRDREKRAPQAFLLGLPVKLSTNGIDWESDEFLVLTKISLVHFATMIYSYDT